jgi:hypothetical protein
MPHPPQPPPAPQSFLKVICITRVVACIKESILLNKIQECRVQYKIAKSAEMITIKE